MGRGEGRDGGSRESGKVFYEILFVKIFFEILSVTCRQKYKFINRKFEGNSWVEKTM
jgi:hypothetical protein